MSSWSTRLPGKNWSDRLRWIGTIVSVVLLVILLARQGWPEIVRSIRGLSLAALLSALGLGLAVHFWNVFRWRAIYRAQEIELPYWDALKLMFAAVFASNFLPTTVGGDVLRVAGISRQASSKVVSTATVVVDRLVGMLGMTFLLPLSVPILRGLIAHPNLLGSALILSPVRIREMVVKAANRLWITLTPWVAQPRSILHALIAAWVGIGSYLLSVWIVARDIGIDVTLLEVAGATSLTYFISVIPLSVNSYGLRELGVVAVYSALGASPDQSAALALITRTLLWAATLPGLLWIGPILEGLGGEEVELTDGKAELQE